MKKGITFVGKRPRMCVSLGTTYTVIDNKIKLMNAIYVPTTKEFGCNYNFNISHVIIDMFNNCEYDLYTADLLDSLGIYSVNKWSDKIFEYKMKQKCKSSKIKTRKYINLNTRK